MGVAGGLVPSPSALVVLLGAVALGRTMFGVLLVLTYGLGMAATLTAAGLLAVRVSQRWQDRIGAMRVARRLGDATPIVTGGLVVVVGLGLAARSLAVL
jgi:ABC-type nickel/cobalt efflux system permease component RcnA